VARTLAPLLLALSLLPACDGESPPPREQPHETPPPPFRHADFYKTLQADAEHFSFSAGDWLEDQGDAPFYGLAFYAHAGADEDNPAWSARADEARARALSLIVDADLLNGDLQEIVMSCFGLIDAMNARDDRADLAAVDTLLDRLDVLVKSIGWYVDIDSERSWALRTYGPTSVSALIGLVNLQYAALLGGDRAAERLAWAKEMEANITERAFDETFYAFGPERPGLFLYPNVAMMALEARLFQLTGDEAYRERARALYDAIQPLSLGTSPTRYYSEYSADEMGAKTRDYSTLSEHNYLVLALLLLFDITRDPAFVEEADSVIDAFSTQLHGSWCLSDMHRGACAPACATSDVCVEGSCTEDRCQDAVLHHWMDGRAAVPEDPSFLCTGCNLQMLYVMWFRQTQL
jgi:hypothetical protein